MPNSGATQFDHLTEEDWWGGLDSKPINQDQYAAQFGASRSSVNSHMRRKYPVIWAQIKGEINKNRSEYVARSISGTVVEGGISDQEHAAKVREKVRDLEEDVRTETGRTITNLKNMVKQLKEERKALAVELLDQRNFLDGIAAASTDPLPKPNFNTKPSGANSGKKPERAVLLPIFDMQYGARVDADDTVGGLGNFNSEVFGERAYRYVRIVSEKIQAEAQIARIGPIVFAIGGDTVEGDEMFQDQAWSLEMPPTQAVLHMRDWLAYIVEAIMGVGHRVGASHYSVVTTPGNHGKVGGKRHAGRQAKYNWDVMVYELLKERLANFPLYNFVIEPGGNCAFEVLGSPFAMIHGDEVASWGSIPFYGMTRMDAKMIRTLNFIPDYVLLGHHHQQAQIPIGYGEWLMSGNWVGATGLSRVVGSNQPKQAMFFVDETNGVLDRVPILLDGRRKPQPTIHKTS